MKPYVFGTIASVVAFAAGIILLSVTAANGCAPCMRCSTYDHCQYVATTTTDGVCWLRFFADGRPIHDYDHIPFGEETCTTTTPVQCFIHHDDSHLYLGSTTDQRPMYAQCPTPTIVGSLLIAVGIISAFVCCAFADAARTEETKQELRRQRLAEDAVARRLAQMRFEREDARQEPQERERQEQQHAWEEHCQQVLRHERQDSQQDEVVDVYVPGSTSEVPDEGRVQAEEPESEGWYASMVDASEEGIGGPGGPIGE